ncbi:kinase-like domain-containing protein [Nemania abortiva]|nr:kinase-like domain-containing protein [Nemania abortiva]
MSTTNNDASPLPLEDMREKLNAALQSSGAYWGAFLPETELLDLVDKDAVAAILRAIMPESQRQSQLTEHDVLAEYFSQKARKVFAILVTTGLVHHTEYLYQKRVLDKMLPIKLMWRNYSRDAWDVESYDHSADEGIHQAFGCIDGDKNPWRDDTIERFFYGQWPLVPARFCKYQFRYKFPHQIRLPFTLTGKDVSNPDPLINSMEEMYVHAHYFPKDLGIVVPVDEKNNFRVAIKKLRKSGSFEEVAQSEVTMLQLTKKLRHDHLIKAIAYYSIGQDHYLMFPWAEMGNLWYFWEKNGNLGPTAEKENVLWMIEQISGLADAVEELHNFLNCRHGNLKPSNILCFQSASNNLKPRLVITDFGAARIQNEYTHERDYRHGILVTPRYKAPELSIYPCKPISRRFDIWSLGCTFLEFAIWTLYGFEELLRLRKRMERFFQTETT